MSRTIISLAMLLWLCTPAWAKHPLAPNDPTLDAVTCGTGATLDAGSTDTAGGFTVDNTTSDVSCSCIVTVPGTSPRACNAMRIVVGDPSSTLPIGCQAIVDSVNNVTNLLIGLTACPNAFNPYRFTYGSKTYP